MIAAHITNTYFHIFLFIEQKLMHASYLAWTCINTVFNVWKKSVRGIFLMHVTCFQQFVVMTRCRFLICILSRQTVFVLFCRVCPFKIWNIGVLSKSICPNLDVRISTVNNLSVLHVCLSAYNVTTQSKNFVHVAETTKMENRTVAWKHRNQLRTRNRQWHVQCEPKPAH